MTPDIRSLPCRVQLKFAPRRALVQGVLLLLLILDSRKTAVALGVHRPTLHGYMTQHSCLTHTSMFIELFTTIDSNSSLTN
ncbi:hypothetical protein BD769DRAFT_1507833 [Suillus cothurnatus]|nr:hypothetical protein BD769DRAFT_1507833 [Suillus cothurnatus]